MIEWKHLQLSSEDYENYIHNEDQEQVDLNDLNISEWQQLYHSVQLRALDNKHLKSNILLYENNIQRITAQIDIGTNPQEAYHQYCQLSNELKVRLSELYSQIDLLHLKNISTTVELIVSRLLTIEEDLITQLSSIKNQLQALKRRFQEVEVRQQVSLCRECCEHIEQKKNRYLKNQILAVEEPQLQGKWEYESMRKYLRDEMSIEENEYEVKRMHYLYDVEEALRNKEKTLKCTSTPIQTTLSEYLHRMLEILQSKKVHFQPKDIREYDKVSHSFDILQQMKKMFDHQEFRSHISQLLEQPFSKFTNRINKGMRDGHRPLQHFQREAEAQTTFLKEVEALKQRERQLESLTVEVTSLRASKNKLENDLIQNLTTFHKYEMKNMELANKNKQLQSDNARIEGQLLSSRQKLAEAETRQKDERTHIIESNITERSSLLRKIKNLELELRKKGSQRQSASRLPGLMVDSQIQTDVVESPLEENTHDIQTTGRESKRSKMKTKKSNRISIQIEKQKNSKSNAVFIKQLEQEDAPDPMVYSHTRGTPKSRFVKMRPTEHSKRSHTVISRASASRDKRKWEDAPSIKMNRVYPLHQHDLAEDIRESDLNTLQVGSTVAIRDEIGSRKKIKKVTDARWGHAYHKSNVENIPTDVNYPFAIKLDIGVPKSSRNISKGALSNSKLKSRGQLMPLRPDKPIGEFQVSCKVIEQQEDPSCHLILENHNLQPSYLETEKKKGTPIKEISERNTIEGIPIVTTGSSSKRKTIQFKHRYQEKKAEAPSQQNIFEMRRKALEKLVVNREHLMAMSKQTQLFISEEEAQKYQKSEGFWARVQQCILVDNQQKSLSQQIQYFFQELQQYNSPGYAQVCLFLRWPSIFMSGKGQRRHRKYRSTDQEKALEPSQAKQRVMKLMKVHQIVHRRCNHIMTFLNAVGFRP